jgi:hypothetical protein
MKKATHVFAILTIVLFAVSLTALAGDVIYISEPSVYDAPKILPRFDAPVDRDFVRNPALLNLECPYEFFSDLTYHGGTYRTSTDGVWGPDAVPSRATGYSDSSYYLHGLGGDAGFAMKLGDSSHLAALVSYRWGYLFGDTDFEHFLEDAAIGGPEGYLYGSWDERLNSHTFGLSVLYNHAFSDTFTFGTGLSYEYVTERLIRKGGGNGESGGRGGLTPESLSIDRETKLRYHRFAPVWGILYKPSDRFTLDASIEAGFSFGAAGVESNLSDVNGIAAFTAPSSAYSDNTEGNDLYGWDIAAKVRPVIKVSDALSFPLVLDFTYRQLDWSADGYAYSYFTPVAYGGIFQGPGPIEYENSMRSWDITAGAGVTYDAGWATLAGLLSYTHSDLRNGYDQENNVVGVYRPGLTAFTQRDNEKRDIVSIGMEIEKRFSPVISAALGLRYDIGWGRREYYTSYASLYETNPRAELRVVADDSDMYQDLTLTTGLTLTPAERLTIALGGMVKFPLDSLDYELDGAAVGWPAATVVTRRFPNDSPFSRDYESSGWEYGGLLTITYEFGCPKPVPPVREEPKIEPKLEPMSMR